MAELQDFPLVTTSGRRGRVFRASRFLDRSNVNRVELEDGTELAVLASDLNVQPDGTFLMDDKPNATAAPPTEPAAPRAEKVPPVRDVPVNEKPKLSSAPVMSNAPVSGAPPPRVEKAAPGRDVLIDEPLFSEEVIVDRVPMNRILDGPAQTRQEGDTTIIPVVEEVITIQKKLLLREEVRITRRRTEIREPRRMRMDGENDRTVGSDGRDVDLS